MAWFDWMPLGLVNYQGRSVYQTLTERKGMERQSFVKYIYSTDTSGNPNSEYAFDIRDLDNPLRLDIEKSTNAMLIVSCAIEKGKIKFPQVQLQKEVDLQDPKYVGERLFIQELIAKEAICKTIQRQLQTKLMKPKIKPNVTIAITRFRIHQRI